MPLVILLYFGKWSKDPGVLQSCKKDISWCRLDLCQASRFGLSIVQQCKLNTNFSFLVDFKIWFSALSVQHESNNSGYQKIICALRDMYKKLSVRVELSALRKGIQLEKILDRVGLLCLVLFNNTVAKPEGEALITCMFTCVHISLTKYREDVLNISKTLTGIKENFKIIDNEYECIGLIF